MFFYLFIDVLFVIHMCLSQHKPDGLAGLSGLESHGLRGASERRRGPKSDFGLEREEVT